MTTVLLILALVVGLVMVGAAWEAWRAARAAAGPATPGTATLRIRCRPRDPTIAAGRDELCRRLGLVSAPPVWGDRSHLAAGTIRQVVDLRASLLDLAAESGYRVWRNGERRIVLRRRLVFLVIEQSEG